MPANGYDVIIIGGGFIGLASAYHLARRGARILLLEANGLTSGTSGACAGRAQVSESHRGLHLALVLKGLARLETLEDELGHSFEWRRLGNLMLIDRQEHWDWWQAQVAHLQARDVPADILDRQALVEAEPALRSDRFWGAAWCLEGHLNPFKYCQAFARAAQRHGAKLRQQTPVTSLEKQGDRLTGVRSGNERFTAETVLVAAGAWTPRLLAMAGTSLPLQSTQAEAMISEPLPPVLNNHVGLADFYETIHTQAQAVSVGVAQQPNGTLLITEAVQVSPTVHQRSTAWGTPGMARDLVDLFPPLAGVRIVRSWAAPSPFMPDEHPAIGWQPGVENLFVATCFHLTITTLPVLTDLIAGMILGEAVEPSLAEFSPARFGVC